MKNFTYLFMFLITSLGFSQTVIFDFEGTAPTFGDFNGSVTQVIANPDATGVNTTAMVAENTVPADAAFAGVNIVKAVDMTADKGFTMDVWSSVPDMDVLLKLEGGTNAERSATTTTTGAWETLTFNFSSEADLMFDSVTVFMNFNVVDPMERVYYWDNVEQFNIPSGDPVALPVRFENPDAVYLIEGFEGAASSVSPNEVPSAINPSANVVRTEKTMGAQFFAGTTLTIDEPIDFSTSEVMVMKTYSPKSGIPVRMKLETAGGAFLELDTNTVLADTWEELTWDFTGMTGTNDFIKIIVFFEFVDGVMGDGSVYYYDDIRTANQVLGTSDFDANTISTYPNPVTNNWNIQSVEEITSINVYNILGKQVSFETPNALNYSIDMSNFAAGIYMATVSTEAGSKTIKVIKK